MTPLAGPLAHWPNYKEMLSHLKTKLDIITDIQRNYFHIFWCYCNFFRSIKWRDLEYDYSFCVLCMLGSMKNYLSTWSMFVVCVRATLTRQLKCSVWKLNETLLAVQRWHGKFIFKSPVGIQHFHNSGHLIKIAKHCHLSWLGCHCLEESSCSLFWSFTTLDT